MALTPPSCLVGQDADVFLFSFPIFTPLRFKT